MQDSPMDGCVFFNNYDQCVPFFLFTVVRNVGIVVVEAAVKIEIVCLVEVASVW